MATRCPVHTPEAANAVFTMLEDVGLGMERMNTHEPVNIPFTPDAATELWTKGKTFNGSATQSPETEKNQRNLTRLQWQIYYRQKITINLCN